MSALSARDRRAVIEDLNATDDASTLGHCLHTLIERTVVRIPGTTALICADQSLTFRDLNRAANYMACILLQRGVQGGSLIAILLQRSIRLVITLLAVLKAGATYVPLDPSFPEDRIRHMLNDAAPRLLVADNSTRDKMSSWKGTFLDVDELHFNAQDLEIGNDNLKLDVQPEDLAYVIYTSGSTGQPKGVEVRHGALCNFLLSAQKKFGCRKSDRMLAITTICFDIAALELFMPLLSGATTVIAESHMVRDPLSLLKAIREHEISIMQSTPAGWQMLIDAGWQKEPRLSKLICGGDALSQRLADQLHSRSHSAWNLYGPTEATVFASSWKIRRGQEVIIGRPFANYRLYVLLEDLSPAPLGREGELFIGGAGLASGYRNQLDKTRSCFIPNPFHQGLMYRTGDLARFEHVDRIVVLGRTDTQVKIRGHRVELGDVEAAITNHEDILDAVVVGRDNKLIAYCKTTTSADRMVSTTLDQLLRPSLQKRLPAYMVPSSFMHVKEFPMTPNNKVDRAALPNPLDVEMGGAREPMTGMERTIFDIWSSVLGRKSISIDDNFFEIGGDSLQVVKVQQQLQWALGQPLTAALLFEYFTIKSLASRLRLDQVPRSEPDRFEQHHGSQESIAIVSMACRLPGGITTPQNYWEVLQKGRDVTTDVPQDRWDAKKLYSADVNAKGKSYCSRGGFLHSIDDFDSSFFGISPREAHAMDPAQRVLLEMCWEAFERAGCTLSRLRGSRTGVYIGVCGISAHTLQKSYAELDGYSATGTASSTMSGRVSYVLGLEGPAMTVDTACSSSLVTTHLACNALRQGECDMALSGGISLLLTPAMHVEFSRLQGISADGRCRPFSRDTQGTSWAEGGAVVVMKRLSDAIRDEDVIHAVVRGTAVNHVGRSAPGLTVPSAPTQKRLIRTALSNSGLLPNDIDYIEAHGTGTKLGDPIEGAALAEVFGDSRYARLAPLWIGSAKSNLGHTQAAAGLIGVLKVILAMQNNNIPPSLHAEAPTPAIDWQGGQIALVQHNKPWPRVVNHQRRAGVTALGIGGTNAHVIIEDRPLVPVQDDLIFIPRHLEVPFLLSARTPSALIQQATKLHDFLKSNPPESRGDFAQVAFSLATTRNHFPHRAVILARDNPTLLSKLHSLSSSSPSSALPSSALPSSASSPRLAMLFTGQGSQLPHMGRALYDTFPAFREAFNGLAAHFAKLEIRLFDLMHAPENSGSAADIDETQFAQPALFALEVALWRLWESWGVTPDFLLGHSVGELAVAHVAGILGIEDACRLVAARGRLMQGVERAGKMVSVEGDEEEVEEIIGELKLQGRVCVAGLNAPTQTVVSGDEEGVERVAARFKEKGRRTKELKTTRAFHSHHMDDVLEEFRSVAETVKFDPPKVRVVSSMLGTLADQGQMECAEYWVSQARQAVRFMDGVKTLRQQGTQIFLELGPHPVLAGMGAACVGTDESVTWVPSLVHGKDDTSVIQQSLAELHIRQVSIHWAGYFKPFGHCRRVELPTYAFQRERYPRTTNADNQILRAMETIDDHETSSTLSDVGRLRFEVAWQQMDASAIEPNGAWGLLQPAGRATWAQDVNDLLHSCGITLRQVDNWQDVAELDGLICLWDTEAGEVGSQALNFAVTGLALLQAASQTQSPPRLVWLTRRAVGINYGDVSAAGLRAAPLWGLARSARNEYPDLRLQLIDHLDRSLEGLPRALSLLAEPECALRDGRVLVPRLQAISGTEGPDHERRPLVRSDGDILITGGLGDLGQRVARWLVTEHGVRHLVLTSRRGEADESAEKLRANIRRLGAESVTTVACDMTNRQSIESLLSNFGEHTRPLRGVVHTAGLTDDGVLSALTPKRCASVFQPKAHGAWILHEITTRRQMDLDLFVMFSSISGTIGLPGQGNYAAANTFLDALAALRHWLNLPGTAIAYGAWEGEGMASRINRATRSRFTQLGLGMLKPKEGLKLFDEAVLSGRALTIAAALNLDDFRSNSAKHGATPSLFSSIWSQHPRPLIGEPKSKQVSRDVDPLKDPETTLNMVRQTAAKILGYGQSRDVDVDRSLQDIGMDSLTAVLMRNELVNLTGLTLPMIFMFQRPNLRAVAHHLLSALQGVDTVCLKKEGPSPVIQLSFDTMKLDLGAIQKGHLDPNIKFENYTGVIERPRAVFITGITGFVGAFIAKELLDLGIDVHCLVRTGAQDDARQRVQDLLSKYGLWKGSYSLFLHPVVGDMARPLLGLSQEIFDHLANSVDAVCHSGAFVNWVNPLESFIGPNIVSTHEILRLASLGRGKTVHVISTISTIPLHRGQQFNDQDLEYGYATSKYVAERLVGTARWRGARASVYRLPFVTASAETGHYRLDQGDFLHNLIAGCVELGAFPMLRAEMSTVLPVDYLSKIIARVMTQDLYRVGEDYDFVNGSAPTFDAFFRTIRAMNPAHRMLPVAVWQEQALAYAIAHPGCSLARIASLLDGLGDDESAAAMVTGPPPGRNVFGAKIYPAPSPDARAAQRYVNRIKTALGVDHHASLTLLRSIEQGLNESEHLASSTE